MRTRAAAGNRAPGVLPDARFHSRSLRGLPRAGYFDFVLPEEVDDPLPLLPLLPIELVVLPDCPVRLPVADWPCALAPVPLPVLLLPLPAWRVSLLPVPEARLPDDEPCVPPWPP